MTEHGQPSQTAAQPRPAAPARRPSLWRRFNDARSAHFEQPIAGPWHRLHAWLDMLLVDHGLVRMIHPNRHQFAPGAWRSGHPTPGQLAAFARKGGRVVVSLRGGRKFGSLPLAVEACARLGLDYRTLVMRSRGLPSRDEFREAAAVMAALPRPVLFHCKSGADRAGFAAALYLMLVERRPVAEARRQLALRYGHIRWSKTGVLDAFFDAYARDTAAEPMPLAEWVETRYDPARILSEFRATPLGTLVGDSLLRRE